jgi:hypothetical protein
MSHADRRKVIIDRIIVTYEKAIDSGITLDEGRFKAMISAEYGCSMRTANEYLKVGKELCRQRKTNTYDLEVSDEHA